LFKDRGLIKWDGLILPEHKKMLQEWRNSQDEIQEKPQLSEDQLEEINREIYKAMKQNYYIALSVYQNKRIKNVFGYIKKFESAHRHLIIDDGFFNKTSKVPLDDIVGAKCESHDIIAD